MKKEEETFRLPFTQQGVAGRGGDEKKKIDGEKIHTRGRKCPRGPLLIFTSKTYVIYICILLLYNIKTVK